MQPRQPLCSLSGVAVGRCHIALAPPPASWQLSPSLLACVRPELGASERFGKLGCAVVNSLRVCVASRSGESESERGQDNGM